MSLPRFALAAFAAGLIATGGGATAFARAGPVVWIAGGAAPGARAQAAFRAVFGHRRSAVLTRNGRVFDFEPLGILDLGGGRIALLSTGVLRNAGHAEVGLNGIHYLAARNRRLRVVGRWFGLGAEGSNGGNVARWGLSRALSRWPTLYTEGGGTWQGCTVSFATLTELRPAGPVDVAFFPTGFDNGGMAEGLRGQQIDGVIAAAVPDRSFTVRYSGSMRFSEIYARTGNRYRLSGRHESRVPGC